MPRLFTGLEIPAEIGQTLSNLRGGLPGARWIDPENYHVTLRFIGDIDGASANEIASLLFRVDRKPFEVKVQGLTSFGGRKPHVQRRIGFGDLGLCGIGLDRAGGDLGLVCLAKGGTWRGEHGPLPPETAANCKP
jgi:hypothetical protein